MYLISKSKPVRLHPGGFGSTWGVVAHCLAKTCISDVAITTQLRGANPQRYKQNFGVSDMSENTDAGRVSIPLQRELESVWDLADSIIEEAYPNIYGVEKGMWGAQRIPNWGILRGAIVRAILKERDK